MRLIGRAFPIFALLIAPIVSHAQEITTYAGGGGTYLTNGILATNALLFGAPQSVAMDQAGNLYYFDVQGYVVRQVNTAGVVNTVAGNGSFAAPILGSIGDGGPATSAGFGTTGVFASIAVDGPGNLYIADPGNNRVRKVDTHGIITTFAGSGGPGNTGDGGPANRAGFGQITGVAVDASGNVYIADFTFGRIRKVDTSGNISTFAGGGTGGDGGQAATASIAGPYGLAADKQGNIYIAEAGNTGTQRVRKVTPGGVISTVAGGNGVGYTGDGGQAINAKFFSIQGIVVDNAGNLYIADHGNEVVRKVDASGIVTTVAGNGRNTTGGDGGFATAAGLNPTGLAVDGSGNLYIGDQTGRVRKVAFGTPPPGLYATALNLSFYATTRNAATANQLLAVTIATLGAPIAFNVSSAVQSGGNWMNMGTTSGTTPTVIQVSAAGNPGAGVYHGTITATPTTPGYSPITIQVTYTITASAPATPAITDVQNGASFQSGFLANSVWTVKGTNLASTTDTWNNSIVGGELPTSLDGVTVTFDGTPAYISYISSTQINLVTPDVSYPGSVVVNNNGSSSAGFNVYVSGQAAPAFFLWPNSQAVATRTDYTYAVAPGTFSGLTTTAAKPGDVLILWGTGFGPTSPVTQDGAVVPGDRVYSVTTMPTITVNNVPATVYGAALAPGFVGLYQVAIQVPTSLTAGNWPIVATVGAFDGAQSPSGVVLAVHP